MGFTLWRVGVYVPVGVVEESYLERDKFAFYTRQSSTCTYQRRVTVVVKHCLQRVSELHTLGCVLIEEVPSKVFSD